MRVGERIAERRAAKGLSQTQLAKRSGLSQGTIGKLEAGISSGSSHLHRIARELGTTPAYLTGDVDDPAEGAAPASELDNEAREMLDHFTTLSAADRRALLQVARSMSDGPAAHDTVQGRNGTYKAEGS